MLVGHDELIKPDRMVLGWLHHHGADVDADTARRLITALVAALNDDHRPRPLMAWEIDHALWQARRTLPHP